MVTAIITGSGRGIGRETALLLAKRGVNVVICSRTPSETNDAVSELRKIHSGVLGMKCNVGFASEVDSLINSTLSRFDRIDILVNNAGIAILKKLLDTTEQEWDETINSNLKSAFLCSKAVLPSMLQQNSGVIINVSSEAGKKGFENLSAYCTSKFGMIGMTESLAWETASTGVRVMAICPGDVDTRMQDIDPVYHKLNREKMLSSHQVATKIVEMIYDNRYQNGKSVDI